MASSFSLNPFLWLFASFALGILLESYAGFGFLVWLLSASAFLLLSAWFWKKGNSFVVVFLVFGFVSAGAFCFCVEKRNLLDSLRGLYEDGKLESGKPVEIFGTVVRKEKSPNGLFLGVDTSKVIFKGEEIITSGFVRIFLPTHNREMIADYEKLSIDYGSGIAVFCLLKREDEFKNKGVVPTRFILDQKGIDATCSLKSPLLVEKRDELSFWNPFFEVLKLRDFIIDEALRIFSVKTAGILVASLLGNPYFLDADTSEAFLEGGIYHVLVVSGLQVMFIGVTLILILSFFIRDRLLLFLVASVFIWLYSLSVGFYEKPVVRAAVMLTVVLLGRVFFRQSTMLNLLALSGFILLVLNPLDLFNPSFQLTFLCVLGIAGTASPLIENFRRIGQWRLCEETPTPPFCSDRLKAFCEALYWSQQKWLYEVEQNVWSCRLFKTPLAEKLENLKLQKILQYLFEALVVTISIQIWLLPLMAVYFHRVSVAGIFLNLWAGFLMSLESLTAIASVLISQVSYYLAFSFILITEALNFLILEGTRFFVVRDVAAFRLAHYSGLMKAAYFLYFLPVAYLSFLIYKWNPFKPSDALNKRLLFSFLSFIVFAGLILFHPFSKPSADGLLHVEFLDVGQGDSIFIKLPTGETFLIDGGGRQNLRKLYVGNEEGEIETFEPEIKRIGETVVSPFLWEKGYSKVDFIIATHADADHIQGLVNVAKNFQVKTAFFASMPFDNEDFLSLYEVLIKKQVNIEKIKKGDELRFENVTFKILNPRESDVNLAGNNASLVIKLCYRRVCFLLTGDIERQAEYDLLEEDLRADVVKVAHHGSRTSSTESFIRAVNAKFAVISAPKNSPFGHPDEQVVERWRKHGAFVLTTGENGTISFVTDGEEIKLDTFSKPAIFR
ncbi:MAG: competence protein ComEC family protein [Pyrinomonadaceae bacterium]|nr:competence protein ComEC family protein [Pyrinomonadaceae bacterium]